MIQKINNIIKKYSEKESLLYKLVVTSFVRFNHIDLHEGFLTQYIATPEDEIEKDIDLLSKECTIEDIISIFELSISLSEKTTNGAVYTPQYIRDYIVNRVLSSNHKPLQHCLFADISCGCGAFLYTVAETVHAQTNASYSSIYQHLFGVDISINSIQRAKILLAIAALKDGECVQENVFNLYCGDSLRFNFMTIPIVNENNGFDFIVGNPPYVRSKHIDQQTKQHLSNWSTSRTGNPDLYIPFFEIGVSLLNESGILGYITLNTFFKSVNARLLRNYITQNQLSLSIINFGEQLVFKKILAYTCLTFISRQPSDHLTYVKVDLEQIQNNESLQYNSIPYSELNNHRGWHLNEPTVLNNIQLIENAGMALGDQYNIKNGIATLANEVYIFRPIKTDEDYYYLKIDGKVYPIEKGICRDIIKPNILKTEEEIPQKEEKIITPYNTDNTIFEETYFKRNYPKAYKYLETYRQVLDERDKGEGDYDAWFAFGRTQAMSNRGRKLLFPYMSDKPHFLYTPNENMLIYCGYAIYHDSEEELLFLKKLLESSVFDYYIQNTSKPYSTGYYSYAKNYVKSFGIYPFSNEQKRHVLNLNTKTEVDHFFETVYGVTL